MNHSRAKNFSWLEKNKALVIAVGFLFVVGISYYYGSRKEISPTSSEEMNEGITLSPEEEMELVREMTPPPDAKQTLSDEELEILAENMTPPKDAKQTLSEDELQELLRSMTPP